LVACAQRKPLTGGDKDIIPPEVKKTTPENQTTNFLAEQITIEFNEFILLDNIQSQLIVSPLMEEAPEIVVRGKKLIIKIKSELTPNTTYSLNFGDAIKDITEGNPYPNYKYVFSTGSFIDSLTYSGITIDAYTLEPQENIFVMLYDEFEDSIPRTKKPRYIAKSDKEGVFSITNIADGEYKLFALNDINSNYLFDLPNEQIGFYSDRIQIDSSQTNNKVTVFYEPNEVQYVASIKNSKYGKIDIVTNAPSDSIEVNSIEEDIFYLEEKNENRVLTTFWLKHPVEKEEVELIINDNYEILDTSMIDLITIEEFQDTILAVSTNISSTFDLDQNIQITVDRPVEKIESLKISLLEDSIPVEIELIQDSLNTREYYIQYPFKEKMDYLFFIEPSAFIDIYGLANDTILQPFKTKKESSYGNLMIDVSPSFSDSYILQLLSKNTIKEEKFGQGESNFLFDFLLPGDYQVKLIVDSNNNKEWDTGKYSDMQPEKIIIYEGEISIQENWDNKIDWVIEY